MKERKRIQIPADREEIHETRINSAQGKPVVIRTKTKIFDADRFFSEETNRTWDKSLGKTRVTTSTEDRISLPRGRGIPKSSNDEGASGSLNRE